MEDRNPSREDMLELLSYLPKLSEEGRAPIKSWHGGDYRETADAVVITPPQPEYREAVNALFILASKPVWCDPGYEPEAARLKLEDHASIRTATLAEIKTLLTYCQRGERFCDGHWGAMVRKGHIRRILERLAVLIKDA